MDKYEEVANYIKEAKKIVLFSGAGISTPSGIPDFRSSNGIYNEKLKSNFSPEQVVSHTFFMNYPKEFYDFYLNKMVYPNAKYNKAHKFFADLEKKGKIVNTVTQNIDGLQQAAGSTNVYELHGSIHRNYCMKCHKFYDLDGILTRGNPPMCSCGGLIKPDVVLYEEGLDETTIERACKAIYDADMMFVVGTSLIVQPAASFVQYFHGKIMVLINKSETFLDNNADFVFNDDVVEVVKKIKKYLK